MSTKTLSCPALVLCPQKSKEALVVSSDHRTFSAIAEVPWSELWSLIPPNRLLLRYDYLRAIEQANPDMDFRYVILYKNNKAAGFIYFQILPLEWDRLQAYSSNSSNKFVNWLGQHLARRILRKDASLLICGNAFISGDYGFHYENMTRIEALKRLMNVAENIRSNEKNITGILLKDLELEDDLILSPFAYNRFSADPNMVLQISPSWKNISDYTAAMSSKYRQRAKSAYKKSAKLEVRELDVEGLKTYQEETMLLFEQMIQEETFNLKNISPDYFIKLKAELGKELRVRAYFLEGKMLSFFTSLTHGRRMEAHYVGFDLASNRELKLYQRMLYDLVEIAIAQEARELSFGRTALEIKSCLGAQPEELSLFLKVSNPFVNKLVGPNIRKIAPEAWQQRNPFKEDYEPAISSKKHSLQRGS